MMPPISDDAPDRACRPLRRVEDVQAALGARRRLLGRLLIGALLVSLVGAFGRVVQLQAAPGDALAPFVGDRWASREEPAMRGDLLDRRGRLLATTRLGRRLFLDPLRFPEPYDANIVNVAEAVGVEAEHIAARLLPKIAENLRRRETGESPVRYATIPEAGILGDATIERVRRLDLPGVHLERRLVREPVAGPETASLVGKVGFEHDGLLGAERALNARLDSAPGALTYLRDAIGKPLWVEAGGYEAPDRGDDVRLSVDLAIQRIATEELVRGMDEADAAGGRVIVLDPHTGEMLAAVDLLRDVPDAVPFSEENLSEDGRLFEGVRYEALRPDPRREIHPALGRNRCVEDAYEPGSTFKPFIWSVSTELGLAEPGEIIDCEGGAWVTPFGRRLEDVVRRGRQSWRDVLVHSSNIGMGKVGLRFSDAQMRDAVKRFGFGERTEIGLPGESVGLVTDLKDWSAYTKTSVPMGYEVAVTPVQMVRAFAAFCRTGERAGTLPTLRLTAASWDDPTPSLLYRVLPPEVAVLARDAMRGVADNMDLLMRRRGQADAEPTYPLFGKSGTAKIARPDGRGYYEQYVSSFVAGAPAHDPALVILVVIDDPGPEQIRSRMHYGSAVAGPVVRRVTERVLPYLGVPAPQSK